MNRSSLMHAHADSHMQRDLMMAAEFQRAVLPAEPEVAFLKTSILYRPYAQVSGDVYNFQLNREGEMSVYLGDATGHGITAALMTMLVHLSLDHFPGNLGTDEILRRLNRMIARHDTGLSIASQLFRISPGGTLRVSHAGQPSLIVLPATGGAPVMFAHGGCPLGMFDREMVPYLEETRQLQQGDRLIAYTDGLVDWKNTRGQHFGEQRLLHTLGSMRDYRLEALSQQLLDAVLHHAGDTPNQDDVTLLCFEYCPK